MQKLVPLPMLTALLVIVTPAAQAQRVAQPEPWSIETGNWEADPSQNLAFPQSLLATQAPGDLYLDPYVTAAQGTSPASSARGGSRFTRSRSGGSRFSTAALRTGRSGAVAGLASVPFMIGDTGAGTCLSFATIGYLEADIAHPTLTCSRLNIAENNRAITSDRVYFSYRHFENASPGRVFQFNQLLNLDRYTLGVEKTLGDGACSIELRVPLDDRITSNMLTLSTDVDFDGFIDDGAQLLGGRDLELANVSAIFKAMLAEHNGFVLSAGLGVTAPTARDVRHRVDIQNIVFTFFDLPDPFLTLSTFDIDTHFTNETWYLSPFLAWANRSDDSRFYYQGFMQFEIAANPMRVRVQQGPSASIVSYDINNPDPAPAFGAIWTINGNPVGSTLQDLQAQPLMRVNLGGGYFLIDEADDHNYFELLVAMAELHYTTTLQDSKLSRIPLGFIGVDPTLEFTEAFDAFDPVIGNLNSRVDILNAVLGVSALVNGTVITNGFTVPLRSDDNRGFDFEYNLQIQRPF